jgi:hypothetical protein
MKKLMKKSEKEVAERRKRLTISLVGLNGDQED